MYLSDQNQAWKMEEFSFPLRRRKTVVNVESLHLKFLNPKGFFWGRKLAQSWLVSHNCIIWIMEESILKYIQKIYLEMTVRSTKSSILHNIAPATLIHALQLCWSSIGPHLISFSSELIHLTFVDSSQYLIWRSLGQRNFQNLSYVSTYNINI